MKNSIKSLFREEYQDNKVKVYLGADEIFSWNNEASIDYPEDLTWGRCIQNVFYEGVRLGMLMATKGAKVK
jgi:hypothetical protein